MTGLETNNSFMMDRMTMETLWKFSAHVVWPSVAGEMGTHYHPTEVAQEEFPEQEEESTAEVGLGPCLWYYLQKLCRRFPPEIDIFLDIVNLFKGFYSYRDLGTGHAIKSDFNPKIYIADFGYFKMGFLSMKLIQKSNFRVQGMFFQQLYWEKSKQDTLWRRFGIFPKIHPIWKRDPSPPPPPRF